MESAKLDYDIVIFALPRWDGPYSSTAYSLAQSLSRQTRVFYIDNPFTWKDFLMNPSSQQIAMRRSAFFGKKDHFIKPVEGNDNLVVATPGLVMPINWLPTGRIYNWLSKWNERIVYKVISSLISRFGVHRFIYINSFNPLLLRKLRCEAQPLLTVYHCVDDISESEYIAKHGTRLESDAVRDADMTLVTSMELKRLKERQSANVYYLPNAANVALFRQGFDGLTKRPEELSKIPPERPIVLYMGNICQRLDYELLIKLAEAHPDKTLVMVGPRTNDSYRTSGLEKLPNVFFTGRKDIAQLPAFVAASACCIIPFLCIPLTRSIYPLKINEYLSGGKPVVTTNFSEDIATFAKVAFVTDTHERFIRCITEAIRTDSPRKAEERVAYAAENSWDARAQQLIDILVENIARNDEGGR